MCLFAVTIALGLVGQSPRVTGGKCKDLVTQPSPQKSLSPCTLPFVLMPSFWDQQEVKGNVVPRGLIGSFVCVHVHVHACAGRSLQSEQGLGHV